MAADTSPPEQELIAMLATGTLKIVANEERGQYVAVILTWRAEVAKFYRGDGRYSVTLLQQLLSEAEIQLTRTRSAKALCYRVSWMRREGWRYFKDDIIQSSFVAFPADRPDEVQVYGQLRLIEPASGPPTTSESRRFLELVLNNSDDDARIPGIEKATLHIRSAELPLGPTKKER